MDMMNDRGGACPRGGAPLPACGRLAASYVPVQPQGCRRYSPEDALAKGTLFPGPKTELLYRLTNAVLLTRFPRIGIILRH